MLDQLSLPTRLREAERPFRLLLSMAVSAPIVEQNPYMLFKFVDCLACIPGKEEEALQIFDRATRLPPNRGPELAARGYISRMLRRVNRIAEAEKYEEEAVYVSAPSHCCRLHNLMLMLRIRSSITANIYDFTEAGVRGFLQDPYNPDAKNYILEHPRVVEWINEQRDFIRLYIGNDRQIMIRQDSTDVMAGLRIKMPESVYTL